MLRITPRTSSARAKSSYNTADYYTGGQPLTGYQRGKDAAILGLTGTGGNEKELLTILRKSETRVGYDFNLLFHKDVSQFYSPI